MKLSVNILAWNNEETIGKCLFALSKELVKIPSEVIVVDNGSVDCTREVIAEFASRKCLNLVLMFNDHNVGISRGKNMSINASEGDYVLMLDADVVPVRNSIICMMEWLDANPDKHAIGVYPNKFTNQKDNEQQQFASQWCEKLFEPTPHNGACLYYGMYRRTLFDDGLRMCEDGEFGQPGYGWEDHDFFMRMKSMGIKQYVAHINNPTGLYYHAINSSINKGKRQSCLSDHDFKQSQRRRGDQFREIWGAKKCLTK